MASWCTSEGSETSRCDCVSYSNWSYHKEVSRLLKQPVDSIQFTELCQHCFESSGHIQLHHSLNELVHHNGTGMSLQKQIITGNYGDNYSLLYGPSAVRKVTFFYQIGMFIIIFIKAHHWTIP